MIVEQRLDRAPVLYSFAYAMTQHHSRPALDGGGGSNSSDPSSSEENVNEPSVPQTTGGIGQVLDAPEPENGEGDTIAEQARDWQIAVEQAENVAKLAGKLPAGVTRSLEAAQAAGVDWRELLRRAWSETTPADYSWTRPNRRHVWNGLYLPGVVCEGVGEICIAVDCSDSINARQLGLFEAEVRSILAGQQPRLVHVLYFDTEVQKVESYQAGQPVKARSGRRRWNRLQALFPMAGRAGHCPSNARLLYGPVRQLS
ncbi:MAG TPA: VWA-like domain-containing protein [Edaphobacter sp.]|nr:VWA-like domain-containing protein [Edaphobacter sp.]